MARATLGVRCAAWSEPKACSMLCCLHHQVARQFCRDLSQTLITAYAQGSYPSTRQRSDLGCHSSHGADLSRILTSVLRALKASSPKASFSTRRTSRGKSLSGVSKPHHMS